jgi:hypothetical protein
MAAIPALYFEKLVQSFIYFYFNNSINVPLISLETVIIIFSGSILIFSIPILFIVVDKVFEIFYKTKINITLFSFYLIFQVLFLIIIIFPLLYNYLIYKDIYFYLKNLINIKLIPLESKYIMFYTSTIFFFLILTVIFIPIIIIHSYMTKEFNTFNTIYNIQIILLFIIFGIIGIIYLYLLNNLKYSIIYLTDIYLIVIYLSISLLVLVITLIKIDFYYTPLNVKLKARKPFASLTGYYIKYIKERNVKKIRESILSHMFIFSFPSQYFFLHIYGYIGEPIPWYAIIFIAFYLYIIFEIIRKKYFLKKETIYQDFYKLSKYFNKRLTLIFGILAFVAIFDTLNFLLLKNYTLQNILQPIKIAKGLYLTMNQDLLFSILMIFSSVYLFCFLIWYYKIFYYDFCSIYHYLNYYALAENIGYKINKIHNEIKNIQISPMITFLSYLALFIVFLINLML